MCAGRSNEPALMRLTLNGHVSMKRQVQPSNNNDDMVYTVGMAFPCRITIRIKKANDYLKIRRRSQVRAIQFDLKKA